MKLKRGQSQKNKAIRIQKQKQMRVKPLPTWDKKKFLQVCADRGYTHERTVVYAVAEQLNLARSTTQELLSTGRMRWEQILVIGAYFEMTPKEFCDVFLSGFFEEKVGSRKNHRPDRSDLNGKGKAPAGRVQFHRVKQ